MHRILFFKLSFLLCSLPSLMAQQSEAEFLLAKSMAAYGTLENYSLSLDYKMFKGFDKNELSESYSMQMTKSQEKIKMSFNTYETYFFATHQVTLDKQKREIYLKEKPNRINQNFSVEQIQAFSQLCNVSMKNSSTDDKAFITLIPKSGQLLPYRKIELVMDKKNYWITRQTFYFKDSIPFTDSNNQVTYNEACLEITIGKLQKDRVKIPDENYFIRKKSTQMVVTPKFNEYKLLDLRTKK